MEFFKPEDFHRDGATAFNWSEISASVANEKINELIKSWPVVYGDDNGISEHWSKKELTGHTKKARLAFIEELPKIPCKHKPTWSDDLRASIFYSAKCELCGVELEAEWKEKK